jgi:hypothetical protein
MRILSGFDLKNPLRLAVLITAILLVALFADNLFGVFVAQPGSRGVDVKGIIKRIEKAGINPREALYYEVIEEHGSERH